MNFRSKGICLLLAAAIAGLFLWMVATHTSPQIITLSNGLQYRFAGATWGTNHSQPRLLAQVVDHLPSSWAAYVRTRFGARWRLQPPLHTAEPCLRVWFELIGTNTSPIWIFGTLATDGDKWAGRTDVRNGKAPEWLSLKFTESPRRKRLVDCQIEEVVRASPQAYQIIAHVKFRNPGFGHFPEWQPDSLPAVKLAGDARVELKAVWLRPRADDSSANETAFTLAITAPRTNESWALDDAELGDATGNRLEFPQNDNPVPPERRIPWTLWPDESALRLRLAFKQTSGFPESELITFSNLPPTTSRHTVWPRTTLTNLVGGVPIVVRNFTTWNFASSDPNFSPNWVSVGPQERTNTVAASIVDVVTDTGERPPHEDLGDDWLFSELPGETKFLNVTVAVQKKRYVEFLVKPTAEK